MPRVTDGTSGLREPVTSIIPDKLFTSVYKDSPIRNNSTVTYLIIGILVLAVIALGYWGWLEMKDAGDQSLHVTRLMEENKTMADEAQANVRTEIAPPTVPAVPTPAVAPVYARANLAAFVSNSKQVALGTAKETNATPLELGIDCATTPNQAQRVVCNDADLSKLNADMNSAYLIAAGIAGNPEQLRQEQLEWSSKTRDACTDRNCIKDAYNHRISELAQHSVQ